MNPYDIPLGTAVVFGAFVSVVLLILLDLLKTGREMRNELMELSNRLHVVARHTSEEIAALQTAQEISEKSEDPSPKPKRSRRSTDLQSWVTDSNVAGKEI
jgi:hypothetical protein